MLKFPLKWCARFVYSPPRSWDTSNYLFVIYKNHQERTIQKSQLLCSCLLHSGQWLMQKRRYWLKRWQQLSKRGWKMCWTRGSRKNTETRRRQFKLTQLITSMLQHTLTNNCKVHRLPSHSNQHMLTLDIEWDGCSHRKKRSLELALWWSVVGVFFLEISLLVQKKFLLK